MTIDEDTSPRGSLQGVDHSGSKVVVQILSGIWGQTGGLTKVALDRFRVLSQGKRSILITLEFQPNSKEAFETLKASGLVPPHTEHLNYHEWLRENSPGNGKPLSKVYGDWGAGLSAKENQFIFRLGRKVRRIARRESAPRSTVRAESMSIFMSGRHLGQVARWPNGRIKQVEVMSGTQPWKTSQRDLMDSEGVLARREYLDADSKPRYVIYTNLEEKPYLSTWMNSTGWQWRTVEHRAEASIEHGDIYESRSVWLREILESVGDCTVYTDEPGVAFALRIKSPRIRHVTMMHTVYFANNRDNTDGYRGWMNHYVNNLANIDCLVFLTELQRDDFIRETGIPREKTQCIPNAAPSAPTEVLDSSERDRLRVSVVSRFGPEKRVEDIIRAFAGVLAEVPDARLTIHGSGPQKHSIEHTISELNVGDSVSVEGWVSSALPEFASSRVVVLASEYEGFGLTILESMAVGTPVVAYDVIYGPRFLIDKENGILVDDGDVAQLTEAIKTLLTCDDNTFARMSSKAFETAHNFSVERRNRAWLQTL